MCTTNVAGKVRQLLISLSDTDYQKFTAKLIPNISPDMVIGVRRSDIRSLAKELIKNGESDEYMSSLPHKYVDEYILHNSIIEQEKDFDKALKEVCLLVPYYDNWAVTDTIAPKSFKKNKKELLPFVLGWIKSDKTYTIRFGICMLMKYYLDDGFDEEHIKILSSITNDDYYVRMGVAWYLATALVEHWDITERYLAKQGFPKWTHNKVIQKACESFRITDTQKDYLRKLKI